MHCTRTARCATKLLVLGFFLHLLWDNQSEMHPHTYIFFEKLINLNCISCCLLFNILKGLEWKILMSIQINQNYLNKIAFLHANKIFLRAQSTTAILCEINGESCFTRNNEDEGWEKKMISSLHIF